MRVLYRFGKLDRLRFISHLDLQRFMQMALRRTDLPVAYSQGFNPHPVISFASALAMGWTSEAEILDVRLFESVDLERANAQMTSALPEGLPLLETRLVDDRHPAMMARLQMADYRIDLYGLPFSAWREAVARFLAEEQVMAMRKTKTGEKETNIRPMSIFLDVKETEFCTEISTRLMLTERETLKPDLLIRTLTRDEADWEKVSMRIHRKTLLGLSETGEMIPLMKL